MPRDNVLKLPQIRSDLQIFGASNNHDGSKNWTIYDPINNHFYRIGALAYQLLSSWSMGNSQDLIAQVASSTTFSPTQEDVSNLIIFLHGNELTLESRTQSFDIYLARHRQKLQGSQLHKILTHYLFFRIPLFRPDNFLNQTFPIVKKTCSKTLFWIVSCIGFMGVYFVSRQWDVFINTFLHFFTMEGVFVYVLALIGTKVVHELGHAYTAKYYGCRVPSIGIAFMVMIPMLYSDMSDTRRLNNKMQRIHVAAAGIINELMLAGIGLFIWNFLPDGTMRSTCFVVATTSIISSLMINLTPFMRFDGYYALADWWGIDNLQQRSFHLAQWKLRQLLFGSIEDKPEHFSPELEFKLICYAWVTWLYRLVLFLGIALLVYHFFFKFLGLILFAVEIIFLIIMPIYKEFTRWHTLRSQIRQSGRIKIWFAVFVVLLGLLVLPWSSQITLPGILTASQYASIYAPESAQIVSIEVDRGQKVEREQVIMVLRSPAVDNEIEISRKQLEFLKIRAARATTNRQDQDDLHVILEQIALESKKLEGLKKRQELLILRAPFDGLVAEMDHTLQPQQWLNTKTPLFFILDPHRSEIKGIASADALSRIETGQPAMFYPEDPAVSKSAAQVSRIDWGDIKHFEWDYLSSQYGGAVAIKNHNNGKAVPEKTVYAIKLRNVSSAVPSREIRGSIRIEGKPVSLVKRFYEFMLSVIIRESGF